MRSSTSRGVVLGVFLSLFLAPPTASAGPVQFESGHVHPLQVDEDLGRLYVVNTPDARLSIFDITGDTPVLLDEVRTGLEPVTVKKGPAGNLWVVSEVSDAVDVIDPQFGSVAASLHVGDEPADLEFVPDPTQPGQYWVAATLSQEDRVVFHQAQPPYAQVASVDIPGSDPRAMALAPDGDLWVLVFESGNQTTMIPRSIVHDPAGPYGGQLPPMDPPLNPNLPLEYLPDNGMMARFQNGAWVDDQGGDWTSLVSWRHDDVDLVRIQVSATPTVRSTIRHVGTLLEDLAVDPATGDLWVANVEQFNHIRFEPNLKGRFAQNRLTRVTSAGIVTPHDLNQHLVGVVHPKTQAVEYSLAERRDSLAFPTEVRFAEIGGQPWLFVASVGGKRIAKVDPASGQVVERWNVPEGGTGLGYHAATNTLYLLNRFANTVVPVDATSGVKGAAFPIGRSGWDPTPANIKAGRRFLYTGSNSATGGFGCVHCHPNANLDNQAWDLGDPSGTELPWIPPEENGDILINPFHPLKGPMTTQTLRGLKDTGRLHWRGDRDTFLDFNGAFESLLGGSELSDADMALYEEFILSIVYPPNPYLSLDDQLPTQHPINGANAVAGEQTFLFHNNNFCQTCHELPLGTQGLIFPIENLVGFGEQPIKIPQLRNMYEKTGFDDLSGVNKRVFGYLHDGMDHNLDAFVDDPVVALPEELRDDLVAFLLSFRTGTHPATGAEVTISPYNFGDPTAVARRDAILAAAAGGVVDVIVHGWTGSTDRGFVYANGSFQSDRNPEVWTLQDLMDEIQDAGTCFTFTGVPLGEGIRMGVDRDLDGFFDLTEEQLGTDPADPNQVPTAVEDLGGNVHLNRITTVFPAPFSDRTTVGFYLTAPAAVEIAVFDVRGRKVATLFDGRAGEGRHSLIWHGRDARGASVAAGTYLVKLRTPHAEDVRKVTRLQ